jgi:acylphosphatase
MRDILPDMIESGQRLVAIVRGDVQGVGFRYSVMRRARQLGLTGYAQNLSDGSVRVEAEGPREDLEELERYLRIGPPTANVTTVQVEWSSSTGRFDGFVAK